MSRIASLGTALMTTWCLACRAYEPLAEDLLGRTIEARAASAGDEDGSRTSRVSAGDASVMGVIAATANAMAPDCACSILCCHADPAHASAPLVAPPAPKATVLEVASLSSVDRAPLVPPPQAPPFGV
ncbi:MAG: hypothetical protein HYX65_01120 [Gemmatimonadetes bacterium]|nr:hypothetical protein [Gemmatimonadota bacterium]